MKNTFINGLKNLLDSLKDNQTYIELGPMFNFSLSSNLTGTYALDSYNTSGDITINSFQGTDIIDAVNHLESKVGNDIFLDTVILKKIKQVEIIKDGEKIVLEKSKDYSINGTSLVFTDGILTAQTQIFIYYDL